MSGDDVPLAYSMPRRKPVASVGGVTMATWRIAVSIILIAVIFVFDTFTDFGSAFAVLYVMPLLITGGDLRELHIIRWSATCAVLTVLSFVIDHGQDPDTASALRMAISLSANFVTTFLIFRAKAMYGTLHASENRYRSTFNSLAVAVWEHDFRAVQQAVADVRASGVVDLKRYIAEHPEFVIETRKLVRITDVNDTAVRLLKFQSKDEFFDMLASFLPEDDPSFSECLLAVDERRAVFQAGTRILTKDGDLIDVIVAMSFAGCTLDRVACSALDVTGTRRMVEVLDQTRSRLEQAQRAAALGQLSASIAHELNQPLSAIKSCANAANRWLKRDRPDIVEAKAALEMVLEAVQQADDVIRGVRTLTGNAAPQLSISAIDSLIEDCAALMHRDIADHGARISLDLGAEVEVNADRILLQQVLVNLIMNAVQAMDDARPSAKLVSIKSRAHADFVEIIVADRGPGWAKHYLETAFEAFQTTKPEGMGLGLSISRAAVETLGGEIRLLDNDGGGACVELRLPIAKAPVQDLDDVDEVRLARQ